MLANVALVVSVIAAVTPFAVSPVVLASVRPFEVLFTEAFLGSFFATLFLFASSVTLLGTVSPFAICVFLREVGETGGVDDGPTVLEYVREGS